MNNIKINAKARNKFPGVLLAIILLLLFSVELYYYPQNLPSELEIFQYLCLIIWITWAFYFFYYFRITYEIRDDGVYLLKKNNVFRKILYEKITQIRKRRGSIYLRTRGFWRTDQILRPVSDIDLIFNEINKRIAEHRSESS